MASIRALELMSSAANGAMYQSGRQVSFSCCVGAAGARLQRAEPHAHCHGGPLWLATTLLHPSRPPAPAPQGWPRDTPFTFDVAAASAFIEAPDYDAVALVVGFSAAQHWMLRLQARARARSVCCCHGLAPLPALPAPARL